MFNTLLILPDTLVSLLPGPLLLYCKTTSGKREFFLSGLNVQFEKVSCHNPSHV